MGKFEDMIAGAGSSLSGKKSKLLLPVPLRPQSRWYEFSDSPLPLTRQVPREICDLLRSNPLTVAAKGTHVSASELLLMETLAMNSLRATSWMDQWLSALGKMIDKVKQPQVMEMLVSGGKSLRYICQQETALWAEVILKRRDAALSNPVPLSDEERTKLRNSPLLTSDFLFSPELSAEILEERKGRRQESFMDSVVALAKSSSSKKASQQQQPGAQRQKKKKKASSKGQQQQQAPVGPAPPVEPRPFHGKAPKASAPAQGPAGKPKGRGRGRGRT